jgi:hypothetical protein
MGWDVVKVDYYTMEALISDTTPVAVASKMATNNFDTAQTLEVDLSTTVQGFHWFFPEGRPVPSAGTTFETGIPFVLDDASFGDAGNVQVKATPKVQFTWAKVTHTTTAVGMKVPVDVPPHSSMKVTGSIRRSTLKVQCTFHLRSKLDHTVTAETKMVYLGEAYWYFAVHYDPVSKA